MALLVRAFLIEEINGWDETALHDYLRANPSLRRGFGFESNHPDVTAGDIEGGKMDAKTFIHMIERMIHRYRHR